MNIIVLVRMVNIMNGPYNINHMDSEYDIMVRMVDYAYDT